MPLSLLVGVNLNDHIINGNRTVVYGYQQSLFHQIFSFAKWYPIVHRFNPFGFLRLVKSFKNIDISRRVEAHIRTTVPF